MVRDNQKISLHILQYGMNYTVLLFNVKATWRLWPGLGSDCPPARCLLSVPVKVYERTRSNKDKSDSTVTNYYLWAAYVVLFQSGISGLEFFYTRLIVSKALYYTHVSAFVAANGMDIITSADKMTRIISFVIFTLIKLYSNVFQNNFIAKILLASKVLWPYVPSVINSGTFAEAQNSDGAENQP